MASSCPRHQASRRRLSAGDAHLVAQIVGPAAIGVNVVEILVQALGQEEADHLEVLVVMGSQPAGVGFGFGDGGSRASAPGERRAFRRAEGGLEALPRASERHPQRCTSSRNDGRLQMAVVAHQMAHHFEQVGQRLLAVDEVARSDIAARHQVQRLADVARACDGNWPCT